MVNYCVVFPIVLFIGQFWLLIRYLYSCSLEWLLSVMAVGWLLESMKIEKSIRQLVINEIYCFLTSGEEKKKKSEIL